GEAVASPSEQEAQLEAIAHALPPLARRAPGLYIDFAWRGPARSYLDLLADRFASLAAHRAPAVARPREGREAIVRKLRARDGVVCQDAELSRSEMWRQRGQYAAVLSPHGGGLDCHRTWEALALGHLVVVPSSSIDPLFAGLRVVAVADWDEVNAGNL